MREIGNLGENDIKNKLLVAAAAVSDHGTNNNLCTAASMASANGGHMNNLEGQHLGLHGLTHHGKLETVPKKWAWRLKILFNKIILICYNFKVFF